MNKNLGQVFTPTWIVDLMIKDIDFSKETILEPSCGDGAFLIRIVENILNSNLKNKKEILENQIEAFEIDSFYYNKCIENLNSICKKHNITNINWNIHCCDTLKYDFKNKKYSYIIGNPPYVRLHNLDKETRSYLKDNFVFCKNGTTDLYLAFYEKCINLLTDNGILSFITPNSFMKNLSFAEFRKKLKKSILIEDLKDFKSSNIFNAATYCAIMTLRKGKTDTVFRYSEYNNKKCLFAEDKDYDILNDNGWILYESSNNLCTNIEKNYNVNIQYGLATLRDKIYISSNYVDIDSNSCLFNDVVIEKDLLRPILKGSKITREKKQEYCIFPYRYNGEKYIPYTEKELQDLFPNTYEYFIQHKEELLKRDMDKNLTSWFQFGRSQGVQTLNNEKLVIDPIVNPNGKVITKFADDKTLVYSGIFITGEDLEEIKEIIESEDFLKYATVYGKDMQGGFKSLNTKLIKNYIKKEVV